MIQYYELQYIIWLLRRRLTKAFVCLWSLFSPKLYCISHSCVATSNNVIKVGNVYTYQEGNHIFKVLLKKVSKRNNFLFCDFLILDLNETTTVCQLLTDSYFIWKLYDESEYEKAISRKKLNRKPIKVELLDFEF
jgi:hypothetical protein